MATRRSVGPRPSGGAAVAGPAIAVTAAAPISVAAAVSAAVVRRRLVDMRFSFIGVIGGVCATTPTLGTDR